MVRIKRMRTRCRVLCRRRRPGQPAEEGPNFDGQEMEMVPGSVAGGSRAHQRVWSLLSKITRLVPTAEIITPEQRNEMQQKLEKHKEQNKLIDALVQELICGLCHDIVRYPVQMNCGHSICSDCKTRLFQVAVATQAPNKKCPLCNTVIYATSRNYMAKNVVDRIIEMRPELAAIEPEEDEPVVEGWPEPDNMELPIGMAPQAAVDAPRPGGPPLHPVLVPAQNPRPIPLVRGIAFEHHPVDPAQVARLQAQLAMAARELDDDDDEQDAIRPQEDQYGNNPILPALIANFVRPWVPPAGPAHQPPPMVGNPPQDDLVEDLVDHLNQAVQGERRALEQLHHYREMIELYRGMREVVDGGGRGVDGGGRGVDGGGRGVDGGGEGGPDVDAPDAQLPPQEFLPQQLEPVLYRGFRNLPLPYAGQNPIGAARPPQMPGGQELPALAQQNPAFPGIPWEDQENFRPYQPFHNRQQPQLSPYENHQIDRAAGLLERYINNQLEYRRDRERALRIDVYSAQYNLDITAAQVRHLNQAQNYLRALRDNRQVLLPLIDVNPQLRHQGSEAYLALLCLYTGVRMPPMANLPPVRPPPPVNNNNNGYNWQNNW